MLAIAADPDDEILGGGATFVKRVRRGGGNVHAVIICETESVRYAANGQVIGQQEHTRDAAKIIDFTSVRCLMLPDWHSNRIASRLLEQFGCASHEKGSWPIP